MKLTDKQKEFILNNIDILNIYELQEIIEKLIDNMDKKYASKLISQMIEDLHECDWGDYENIEDCGDR